MMTDPIADMLARIRNAQSVGKPTVVLPSSKLKRIIAELLVREGWLAGAEVRPTVHGGVHRMADGVREELALTLRYRRPGTPWITSIRRVSKPGRRVYVTRDALPRVKSGTGIVILSTPRGIMTNREARTNGIGGEVICEVY